jgi:glycosyltransferase involved in cell wall biosynthesis
MSKLLYGIPWMADYRDYTVDAVIFHQVGQIRQRLLRWMEGHYLASADVVIGNTERAGKLFEESGASGKVAVIPNGADPSEWEGLKPLRGSGKFRMVHAGRFVKGRTPEPFLEALAMVRDRRPDLTDELVFSMVGPFSDRYNGSHDPNAANILADRFGVREMIEVIGPVDHSTALRYMLGADALVLFNIIGTSVPVIPAKLYEYLHMGKPVFAVHENTSEGGRILSASGMGIGVGSRDPAEIAEALEQFLIRCRDTPSGAGWVHDDTVPESYHSRHLAKKLDHLAKQTFGRPSGG